MANPWDADEIVRPSATAAPAGGNPWDHDEIVAPANPDALAQAQAAPITDLAPVQAEAPPLLDQAGRALGLGARAMIGGVYDLSGIVADPIVAGINALGGNQAYSRQSGEWLSDKLGLPKPATATERVAGDITSGVTGGGGYLALGRGLAARAPGVVRNIGNSLAAMPGTQLASAAAGSGAAGATREAGGGAVAQTVAGLAGGLAPSYGVGGIKETLRRAVRGGEQGRKAMESGINDFRMMGVEPSVGQATGNRRTQGIESLLAGGPTSGGVMTRFAEKQADDIGAGLRAKADEFKPNASSERAGRAVEKGVDTAANNINATRKALYWQVDQHIPDTTQLSLSRTQRALSELISPTPGATATTLAMVNPKISALAKNVADDLAASGGVGMPYAAVKDIRSRIGQELSDFSLTTDKPTAEYKRLYAALSQDLEEAARQQGPAATQAAKRANNYFKVSAARLEQLERVVDKSGGPEKVYAAVMSGTQDGGTTLRAVMQSLPKDGQRALTGAVIKRMGLATKGNQNEAGDAFSAQTFLSNWNGVSNEAKRALFDRHGPKFAASMDRVARVAERIRDGSKVFANPSGTANKAAAYGYVGTLVVSLLDPVALTATVGSGVTANLAARAMTNPRFVSALARSTEWPASALPQFVLELKREADRTGDSDLAEIAESLEQRQQRPD